MIRQKYKQEISAKPGAAGREPALTSQAKNTMMHLNGQSLRLATKNGRDSKTPGLHLSATHGEEAAGRLTPAVLPVRDGASRQRDSLLSRSPLPDSEREGENLPPRRPLKLAPLELPKGVREAQRQKIKGVQLEAKAAARKLDVVGNEPCPRKLKARVREGLVRSPECPPLVLAEPARGQRALLLRGAASVQRNGVGHPGDAAPPVGSKPVPPSPAPSGKAGSAPGGESVRQNVASRPDAGSRRLRLRRVERLEEDQSESNTSAGGLSTEGGAPAQRGHGGGLRAERALREASRVLEKASRKSAGPPPQQPANIEVSGRAIRRTAVSRLQDAAAL